LTEAIRKAKNLPAADIIASLHSVVLQFATGTEQQDDLTAVIVKRQTAQGSGSPQRDLSPSGVHGGVHTPRTAEQSSDSSEREQGDESKED
jgi:hypothetical protein